MSPEHDAFGDDGELKAKEPVSSEYDPWADDDADSACHPTGSLVKRLLSEVKSPASDDAFDEVEAAAGESWENLEALAAESGHDFNDVDDEPYMEYTVETADDPDAPPDDTEEDPPLPPPPMPPDAPDEPDLWFEPPHWKDLPQHLRDIPRPPPVPLWKTLPVPPLPPQIQRILAISCDKLPSCCKSLMLACITMTNCHHLV